MIRAGVIGFGLGGTVFHAPLIDAVDGLELAAIATSRSDAVRAAYPRAAVTTPAALIADPDIALVAISTPNDTHFALATAALEAGKHVVIDKPFATSVAEAEAITALADLRGLVLAPFHNRRWDSDFLTVRRLLDSGRLGEILLFEAHWDRLRPDLAQPWKESPEAGAGQLLDLGPHMIDQALLLFGMPEAVRGDLASQRVGSRVDDYFDITLHYGERRVVLSSSRMVAAPRPRFGIHGRNGSFVKYGLDPQEAALRAGGSIGDPAHGIEAPADHGTLTMADGTRETIPSERGDYRQFYAAIARAIAEDAPVPVPAEDAVAGLRLLTLARQSAHEGRVLTV
ncbi:oxidoreductase [Sphingomonas hengshuiensis]|uniref:Oxidoreductase n=1 Tax=Sphingomonas hengshuiensis TaxID=1609977 RepID=A0A7U4J7N6_9SPHN|nr:oxidoreductase [Sphingomonas hengshuiensis]AJP71738.1 oxidoreductase [Sphingomonas hengshuiensis]